MSESEWSGLRSATARASCKASGQEHGQSADAVCSVQLVDGAQTTLEYGGAAMSAPEMGQRAANGAEIDPRSTQKSAKMLSSENSNANGLVSDSCAPSL
jgi:hypothetical protein